MRAANDRHGLIRRVSTFAILSIALVTLILIYPGVTYAGLYYLEAIPLPATATASDAIAINNRGEVVGNVWLPGHIAGYIWSHEKGIQLLPSSPFHPSTQAHDINEFGDVVGWSRDEHDKAMATIWENGNKPNQLLTLGGNVGISFGLNDKRDAVGHSFASEFSYRFQATVWIENELPINPDPDNIIRSMAIDINNAGVTLGYIWRGSRPQAFTWSVANGYSSISAPNSDYLRPYAINESGWFTGSTIGAGASTQPALVDPHGNVQLIAPDKNHAAGKGINDYNTIVGDSWIYSSDTHAMIWDEQYGMRDLNDLIESDLGWLLTSALDINNSGQIVGRGIYEGRIRAFILTPIPEPTTLMLFIAPMIVCMSQRRA